MVWTSSVSKYSFLLAWRDSSADIVDCNEELADIMDPGVILTLGVRFSGVAGLHRDCLTVRFNLYFVKFWFIFTKIECGLYFLDRFDVLMLKMIFKK